MGLMAKIDQEDQSKAQLRANGILNSAMQLFADEGYHAVSTRKIAAKAGVSEGTLFNHFGAKQGLMRALLESIYGELKEKASEILKNELATKPRLQALALNHIRVMSRDNALFMRLIQSYMNVDISGYTNIAGSVLHEMNLSYAWVFDFAVKEGIERGEIRQDINISALRDLFFGGLEYGSRSMFLHNAFNECETRVASLIEPLWLSMQVGQVMDQTEPRLTEACQRLEDVALRLESLQSK